MLFAFNDFIWNRVVFAAFISQLPEHEACREHPYSGACNIFFGNLSFIIGFHDVLIGAAAVEIAAGL